MKSGGTQSSAADDIVRAAQAGDETAFATLVERHRRELHVHCYRMTGSFDDAEDLVQETFLRAWRNLAGFEGRSTFRAWLYRIATNACLDTIARRPASRQTMPRPTAGAAFPPAATIPWLQPYPDRLLPPVAPREHEPEAVAIRRETIELAFLAAIQHLPPRQRAVLILRDVVGWPARDVAEALETSVAATNSALQRARATLRRRLPPRRLEWHAQNDPTEAERAVIAAYIAAIEQADDAALAELLQRDIRVTHQSGVGGNVSTAPATYDGRDTVIAGWAPILHATDAPELLMEPTGANGQPAIATWIRTPGETVWRAFDIVVLRIEDGTIAEMEVFSPSVLPAFGLSLTRNSRPDSGRPPGNRVRHR